MKTKLLALTLFAAPLAANANVDPCVVGLWVASSQHMVDQMKAYLPADQARIVSHQGQMVMAIEPSGQMTTRSDGFRVNLEISGIPMSLSVTGQSSGSFTTQGNEAYVIVVSNYNLNAIMDFAGSRSAIPFSPGPAGGGSGEYLCGEQNLSMIAVTSNRAGSSGYPVLYHRASH